MAFKRKPIYVFVDFETRSRCNLDECSESKYAQHLTTEVLCMCYAINGADWLEWAPGDPVPEIFFDPRAVFVACRAGFEIAICRYQLTAKHGFPRLPDARWECEAAMAAYMGLPQGLDKQTDRLELGEFGKDSAGHANMLRLCKPNRVKWPDRKGYNEVECIDGEFVGGEFDNDPARHDQNVEYCGQDVVAERAGFLQLTRLPQRERQVWLLHRKINTRGVPVDLELCDGAISIIERAKKLYLGELAEITGGMIDSVDQRERIIAFATARGVDLRKPHDEKANLQEETVSYLVGKVADPKVNRILEIRQLLTSSAIDKFYAARTWAEDDWRCRDALNYYGAGPGRWSCAGPQFQNMKRPDRKPDVIEEALPAVAAGDYEEVERLSKITNKDGSQRFDIFGLLGDCTRSIIQAPEGKKIVVSDFASIEARKVAWLSGCESLLDKFRKNEELYVGMACRALGCTPQDIFVFGPDGKIARDEKGDKKYAPGGSDKRQLGKVFFLGPQYQMGWVHLQESARDKMGIELSDELSQTIIDTFRNDYPEIPNFWRDIEGAAKWCVKNNKPISHPKFKFRMYRNWLVMQIPCGRELFYFNPRTEPSMRFRGQDQLVYDSARGVKQLYGGLLTENITQASSRDLLCDAMFRIDALGIELFMHCHDETVSLCDVGDDETPKIIHAMMKETNDWAEGMPVDAETKISFRYTK